MMGTPKTIQIDGVDYIRKSGATENAGTLKILVLQRGWVIVGRVDATADRVVIHNGAVVRVWGTKKGLPEIANDGPTEHTILDECDGEMEVHPLAVVLTLTCNQRTWDR